MTTLQPSRRGLTFLAAAGAALLAACPPAGQHNQKVSPRAAAETVTVKDREAEQRAARLEVRLLEADAALEDLQGKLDEARQEVVRAMAKLQTFATRAEAASGMAEAEIALDSLKAAGAQQAPPELGQGTRLLQLSGVEFNKLNYGGALYLANQAKGLARAGHGRIVGTERVALRPGELVLALPLQLRTVAAAKVRDGPGTTYKVLFTLDTDAPLVGYSYLDAWLRVGDESGRIGWIYYNLVTRRAETK